MCLHRCGYNYLERIAYAKAIAIVDIVINFVFLAGILICRPMIRGHPNLGQSCLWHLILIVSDSLLVYGLNKCKVTFIALWKTILFLKVVVNLALVILLSVFALANMTSFINYIIRPGGTDHMATMLRLFTFVIFGALVAMLPFDIFFLATVNKATFELLTWLPSSTESLLTEAMRYRAGATSSEETKTQQLGVQESWLHEDMISRAPRPRSHVLSQTQPVGSINSGIGGFDNPMKPFMPMYLPHPALRYSANFNQVSPTPFSSNQAIWQG